VHYLYQQLLTCITIGQHLSKSTCMVFDYDLLLQLYMYLSIYLSRTDCDHANNKARQVNKKLKTLRRKQQQWRKEKIHKHRNIEVVSTEVRF